ncbi:catecholate siderophore receptor Fiu [Denitratisoma sp. agr-D3]
MAYIKRRKHAAVRHPAFKPAAAFTLLAMASHGALAEDSVLSTVEVKATAEATYKADKVSSPKFTQPLVDTPQTISVVKKELLQEQGATSLMDALRNTPGITMQLGENGNTSAGDTYMMRGVSTESATFVDGIRDLGAITRDTFNIEQVEIVKGPAGTDIGRGASSGYINLVSKLPTVEDLYAGSASLTSANGQRYTADINKKVGDTSAIRLNIMSQGGDVPGRDHVEKNYQGFAPSFATGLGTPTRFYLFSQHIQQHNRPDGGLPTVGLPGFYYNDTANLAGSAVARAAGKVDSENYYGSLNDYERVSADMVTAKVEHDINSKTTLRNTTRYGKTKMDRIMTGIGSGSAYLTTVSLSDPSTWTIARTRQGLYQVNEMFTNQTNLTTEFDTGAFKHSLSAGVELIYEKQRTETMASTGLTIPAANLYSPNADTFLPVPYKTGAYVDGNTTTLALYAFDTMKLNERWQVNGGLRVERYRTSTSNMTLVTSGTNGNQAQFPGYAVGSLAPSSAGDTDHLTSWKVGALYKPAANGSIYLTVANSMTPPGGNSFNLNATASATGGTSNNPNLDPLESENRELGTKWDLFDKKLALTAALYQTTIRNEIANVDPVNNIYAAFGKRTVEGIELGAVGNITDKWQISAGLATMDTKIKNGSTGNNSAGAAARWSPDLTFTLWSSYALPGGWTVGGGARYTSDQKRIVDPSVNTTAQSVPKIPSYWVADMMASYRVDKHTTLQLNIYNLFDKEYIATLNNGGGRYTPGTPRYAMVSANFQF